MRSREGQRQQNIPQGSSRQRIAVKPQGYTGAYQKHLKGPPLKQPSPSERSFFSSFPLWFVRPYI
ncbi:hypothetical protein D7Z26_12155 [Cohnella endophytica]|uniref:Uncharacterized protein n=1 Tax=Cohnella endophytica TaxID=2419778 RepID=A0A494XYL8_9BACL|nr:hypothetical protein D7Z26_12155 [Cohnella endophytica]